MLPFIAAHGFGLQGAQFVQAQAARSRLTVAGETPASVAICLPVQRWRRSRAIVRRQQASAGITDAAVMSDRPNPPSPSRRYWSIHLCIVRGQTPQLRQRPPMFARPRPAPQFALDRDGHSYGRSSDPPGVTEASTTSSSPSASDGQPIESSHLAILATEPCIRGEMRLLLRLPPLGRLV